MMSLLCPGNRVRYKGVKPNRLARLFLAHYNRKQVFDNLGDDRESLERELTARFDDVRVEQEGLVALFSAQ